MAIQKLLFVDANIWLDFYRARTEAGLSLLRHLDAIADRIVVTYQLEMEFKKNRQTAILEGMQELKPPQNISRPALFSDAKAVKALQTSLRSAEDRVKKLKQKFRSTLDDPTVHDPVYKVTQRIFHKSDDLVLTREDSIRRLIRRRAFRRFIHGCPPRKRNDTSIGDAMNWEWMIECAIRRKAELVIVTRDSDYGVVFDGTGYINDHLIQEFGERVRRKRKILLYAKLSEALRHFKVPVTTQEAEEEDRLVQSRPGSHEIEVPTSIDDLL